MDNGLLIVKANFNSTGIDRKFMHDDICKQLEKGNVVVLPLGWIVEYYPPGTEVVVGKTNEETRTCPVCKCTVPIPVKECPHCHCVSVCDEKENYGWEHGRKALIDDVKSKIETDLSWEMFDEYGNETALHKSLMDILDNIGKEESEEQDANSN